MSARVSLPEPVMRAIQVIADDTTMGPQDRLVAIMVMAIGAAWYETQEVIDPTQFVLPDPQWRAICLALMTLSTNGGDQVNLGLAWVNQGLSGDPKWDGS